MHLLVLAIILAGITQNFGQIQFTSPYNKRTVSGLFGSSVNFTWSFSGAVDTVTWGIKSSSLPDQIESNQRLVILSKTGQVSVTVPQAYKGRVSGFRSNDASSGQAVFTLTNITRNDEKYYGCQITPDGPYSPVSDFVQLVVAEKPNIDGPTTETASYNEDDPVSIACTATGKPNPNVTWSHKGQVKSSGINTASLVFNKIVRADAGTYICRANNPVGTAQKTLNLIVKYKPENIAIAINTPDNTAVERQDVTVTCHVRAANPPVSEYKFLLNGTVIKTGKVNHYIIYDVRRARDYGKYTCSARNDAGVGRSDAVVLNIKVPAKIHSLTGNLTVNETKPIVLRCHASGYPAPNVTWKRDGSSLKSKGDGVFYIGASSRSDSGVYSCIARNGVGHGDQSKRFVTVNYAATIEEISSSVSKSWISQNVKLTCKSNGVPSPTLSWQSPNGTEFSSVKHEENVVFVKMNSDQDFGEYKCSAVNGFNPVSRTVIVEQIKAPGKPTITTTAADIQATSITVNWTAPGVTGGSPITAFRVVILDEGNVIKDENVTDPTRRTLYIGGLTKSTNYTVKVFARNVVFEGDASQKVIRTRFQGIPAAAEIFDLPAETRELKVTIKWSKSQDNGATITKYTVYRRTVGGDATSHEWKTMGDITDVSKREIPVELMSGKKYEFVVTATNKFGESYKEDGKVKSILVGDVPAAVVFTAKLKDGEVTLRWSKPDDKGANITEYSIYQRNENNEQWKKIVVLKDVSKLELVVKVEKGKKYQFVVTATNKYGESSKNKDKIKEVDVLGDKKSSQDQTGGGVDIAIIAGAAAAGGLLILGLILFVVWWKRRKTSSDSGSSVADLRVPNPDDFDDGYHTVGAASAARQLQASGPAGDVTYAQVDMSQKKDRRPVTDVYAEVDKSKKSKKKPKKQPGELDYAELDDLRPNFRPAPQPSGAAAKPIVRAPAYEGTVYADIAQFGIPQPEPTYDNLPKKDVVYSNVESM